MIRCNVCHSSFIHKCRAFLQRSRQSGLQAQAQPPWILCLRISVWPCQHGSQCQGRCPSLIVPPGTRPCHARRFSSDFCKSGSGVSHGGILFPASASRGSEWRNSCGSFLSFCRMGVQRRDVADWLQFVARWYGTPREDASWYAIVVVLGQRSLGPDALFCSGGEMSQVRMQFVAEK